MLRHRQQKWAVCLALLVLSAQQGAWAGLIISSDNSDLCNNNLKDCKQRCPPPQSFLFLCSSGGTFSKPQSDCKCVIPAPAGVDTDGTAIFKMVQWPGTEACQGNTWLYDCAQFLTLRGANNQAQGQALDEASALAAVNAAKLAQAQAAAAAQAQAAASQQSGSAGSSPTSAGASPAGPSPAGVPGLDTGVPGMSGGAATGSMGGGAGMGGGARMGAGAGMGGAGMGGAGMGGAGMGGAGMGGAGMGGAGMGGTGMGGAGMGGAGMGGSGMGGAGTGMGGVGAGMMGGSAAMPGSSLMSSTMMGHRHLLQFDGPPPMRTAGTARGSAGAGMGGAGMGAGSGMGAGAGMSPAGGLSTSTSSSSPLLPACQKPVQGIFTSSGAGILIVPNFKGIAAVQSRSNDTLFVQLGGQGSNCVAGYKLMGGKILDLGRTKEELQKQQDATKKSGAAAAAPAWGVALLVAIAGALLL